ncbi:polysaccharide biosynthesis protein [Rhizobium sp. M1]|uniref:polysaccharide biosynthesis protein n=1 Tax=Rhizobium sp. M1 TaxID=2035453 RepID=UPI000BEAE457|nr:polysaccharide biosynthesis protein [Rhizobium sp. M1]PDT07180.1 polysaccharide biosynthesis protein [Rhizobium sp. M1]
MNNILEDKRILITGGTGSLGKSLVRRIISGERGSPKKVIVMSRDEGKQHEMRLSYLSKGASTDEVIYRNFLNMLEFRIGDVRSYADVCAAMRDVDIVINAAALKQVPTCEYFPEQAVMTNCEGPVNIVRSVRERMSTPEVVIGVSTDKACKPVNVMGMTKAIHERIFIAGNVLAENTRFVGVRYGNVLASRGSVIPVFHEQIKNGGPVTLTVPEMTRFLLTLDQAVDTVFEAIERALPGEIVVPRAPAATVLDIAKALIGERDIATKIVGIRPGEKMHELMVSEEECDHTIIRGNFMAILPMLPELQRETLDKSVILGKEFSSADTVMTLAETRSLLERHKLLVEQRDFADTSELLR